MTPTTLEDQIGTVMRRLAPSSDLPPATLEVEVRAAFDDWRDARVRDFVPIFVERQIRHRHRVGFSES